MKITPSFVTSLRRGDNGAYAWMTTVIADYPHPGGKIGYCQAPSAIESMQAAVVWFETNRAALELKHAPQPKADKAEPVLQAGLPEAEPETPPAKPAVRPWGNPGASNPNPGVGAREPKPWPDTVKVDWSGKP